MSKFALPLLNSALPHLHRIPTTLLSLPASLFLYITSTTFPTPWSYLKAPTTHPLHPPILLTATIIPLVYIIGLISGNVSIVDRLWPIYTPIHSLLIVLYAFYNPSARIYAHNLPRMCIVMALQGIWCTRLQRHAIKRGVYDRTAEDYRYTQLRKMVPTWFFQLIHLFAVAIPQPLLLWSLCLPLHALLILPPSELSGAPVPALSLPWKAISPFLPSEFQNSANPETPILNLGDLLLVILSLTILYIEDKSDLTMNAYQNGKHGSNSKDLIHPAPLSGTYKGKGFPTTTAYPKEFHPGFVTSGLFKWSRHPNFAAEQLFWLTQALFVVTAGESSAVTRAGWVGSSIFAGPFFLSLLFCGSTAITEWITSRKYPLYHSYKSLVGQFLPQETFLIWLWGTIWGTRPALSREVYQIPSKQELTASNKAR